MCVANAYMSYQTLSHAACIYRVGKELSKFFYECCEVINGFSMGCAKFFNSILKALCNHEIKPHRI